MKQKPVQESKLNIQLRPASIEEAGLFYSQMEEGKDQTLGTVGHLRMAFDPGRQEFWSTWWEHNHDQLTTLEFKRDLKRVVDELRRSGPLKDLKTMRAYCGSHGGAIEDRGATYGYIAETEHYDDWGDLEEYGTDLKGKDLRGYEAEIRKALVDNRMPEEAERGIMQWYDEQDGVNDKVQSIATMMILTLLNALTVDVQ